MTTTIYQNNLEQTFAALANKTRLAILDMLAQGEATVSELAKPFNMSLPAISKHIKVLEKAGLITQFKQAQFRRCRLNPQTLQEVAKWTEQYRDIWENRFDQMDQYVEQIKHKDKE